MTAARLVLPHQLFTEHLAADRATLMVLVEPDLFFRQYPFHKQKLVLHRASLRAFADRLAEAGFTTEYVETSASSPAEERLAALLRSRRVRTVTAFEVVDDWLERDLRGACESAGATYRELGTPGFLTTTDQAREQLGGPRRARMQHFYEWQRRRLGLLMDSDEPVGGRWSFDTENRRRLPPGTAVPDLPRAGRTRHVRDALRWVEEEFGDNPGEVSGFGWPTTHGQARHWLTRFLHDRLAAFGPYEDAMAVEHDVLFHSAVSPLLNTGLLDPRSVVDRAVRHASEHEVDLPSLEGFVRQVVGWREYLRAAYVVHGRAMRTRNELALSRRLPDSWYDASTGLDPLDTVIDRVLRTGYAHHIERLMVAGNAALLLRLDPDEVYEWFMTLFIDAYDWVMVPNVYAMSQFAAGDLVTTKPYVSGSNYLRKMGDFPTGDWVEAWDALYWQFVADYRDRLAANPRTSMMVRGYDRLDPDRRARLAAVARRWLTP